MNRNRGSLGRRYFLYRGIATIGLGIAMFALPDDFTRRGGEPSPGGASERVYPEDLQQRADFRRKKNLWGWALVMVGALLICKGSRGPNSASAE